MADNEELVDYEEEEVSELSLGNTMVSAIVFVFGNLWLAFPYVAPVRNPTITYNWDLSFLFQCIFLSHHHNLVSIALQVDEQVTAEKPQAADGKEVKKWVKLIRQWHFERVRDAREKRQQRSRDTVNHTTCFIYGGLDFMHSLHHLTFKRFVIILLFRSSGNRVVNTTTLIGEERCPRELAGTCGMNAYCQYSVMEDSRQCTGGMAVEDSTCLVTHDYWLTNPRSLRTFCMEEWKMEAIGHSYWPKSTFFACSICHSTEQFWINIAQTVVSASTSSSLCTHISPTAITISPIFVIQPFRPSYLNKINA